MMNIRVTLAEQTTKRNGKSYTYWVIRWQASDGRRLGKTLGRTNEMSRRQAEKVRRQKELELESNPGRRDVSISPELGEFLGEYQAHRKSELAAGTLELHERTGRYLIAYFGERRRLDTINRAEARAFKTCLGSPEFQERLRATVDRRRKSEKKKAGRRKPAPPPPKAKPLAVGTVEQHVRQARVIFQVAVEDNRILVNPFDRLAHNADVEKDWHYVGEDEFARLMAAAKPAWRLTLALAR